MKIENHDVKTEENEEIFDSTSNELSRMTEEFEYFLNHSSAQNDSVQTEPREKDLEQVVFPNVLQCNHDFSLHCIPTIVQENFDVLKIDVLMKSIYEKNSEANSLLNEPHIKQETFKKVMNKKMQSSDSHTPGKAQVSIIATERKKNFDSIENTSNELKLPNSSDRRSLSRVIDSINRNQMLLKINCLSDEVSRNRHAHQLPWEFRQQIDSEKQIDEILNSSKEDIIH